MKDFYSDGRDCWRYTSGRWLRGDQAERDARYIAFDYELLGRRVLDLCPGAQRLVACEKKEGGFNRVFVLTADTGQRLVAKLPFALAGPTQLTTKSEVATIKFIQLNTAIPIPKILEWNADDSNPVGSDYIIMEHATGIQLHEIWPSMSVAQKIRCIQSIYTTIQELPRIDFSAYGSLYFNGPAADRTHRYANESFRVGQHCGSRYTTFSNLEPHRGPWPDLVSYGDGLVNSGISRIPSTESSSSKQARYHGTTAEHLELLGKGRAVIRRIAEHLSGDDSASPILFHPDLHMRNIYVTEDDPTTITAIIDWQSASIEPAFWYADETPDFVQKRSSQPDIGEEQCQQAYGACTRVLLPRLARPRLMNTDLFRPFRYCHRTWTDGAVALRHELMEIARQWHLLGLPGSCPYPLPSSEAAHIHAEEYQRFKAAQDLKRHAADLLNVASDGWAPVENWEATQAAHKEFFDGALRAVLDNHDPDDDEPIRTEADLREIWPFDLIDPIK